MAADNHTTIIGNLVEDPEVRFTNTGIAVTNLRVAVTQRVQQEGQWRDGDTSFFKVNVWRGQALGVEVELVDQQHVGADPLDDLGHRLGLDVVWGREVGDQLPLGGPVQRGVEGRKPSRPPTLSASRRIGGSHGRPVQGEKEECGQQHGRRRPPPLCPRAARSHRRSSSPSPTALKVLTGNHDVDVDYGRTAPAA